MYFRDCEKSRKGCEVVEALAIRSGSEITLQQGFHQVIIKGDAKLAFEANEDSSRSI